MTDNIKRPMIIFVNLGESPNIKGFFKPPTVKWSPFYLQFFSVGKGEYPPNISIHEKLK